MELRQTALEDPLARSYLMVGVRPLCSEKRSAHMTGLAEAMVSRITW